MWSARPFSQVPGAFPIPTRNPPYFLSSPTISPGRQRKKGLCNVFVTNGYMTGEMLDMMAPFLDAANVDLKSFSNDFYRRICRGKLDPVLNSIEKMKKLGIWIEVTTLIRPRPQRYRR